MEHYGVVAHDCIAAICPLAVTAPVRLIPTGGEGAVSAAKQHLVFPALIRVPVTVSRIDDAVRPQLLAQFVPVGILLLSYRVVVRHEVAVQVLHAAERPVADVTRTVHQQHRSCHSAAVVCPVVVFCSALVCHYPVIAMGAATVTLYLFKAPLSARTENLCGVGTVVSRLPLCEVMG